MQLVHSSHASNPYSTRVLLTHTTCTTVDAACALFARLEPLLHPCAPGRHELPRRCYSLGSLRTPRSFTRPGFPGRHELRRRCYSLCSLRTPWAFTRPKFPGRHELPRRCYSLCRLRTSLPLLNQGSLAGLNCSTDATGLRQLVHRVEDVVAGDLCELYHDSCYHLVVPLLLLVHQLILWLVQGQFRPYFGGVGEVVAFHTVALYHILPLIFLADGDGTFLTAAGDVHANDS